jgi:hypothetical protein
MANDILNSSIFNFAIIENPIISQIQSKEESFEY